MSATLAQGTVIGGFTIGPPLGQGGFGITYLVHDNKSGKKFALKEYFPSDFADRHSDGTVTPQNDSKRLFDYGRESFITEANILRTLPRQRGLVQVRGAFERMGTAYCIMEYIEGEPLSIMIPRLLRTHGGVPQELVEQFLDPITQALAVIHSKKLIHRDIKPGNIMIRPNGEPVLIDFGAARIYGKKTGGTVMFTRKYAPIEQFPSDEARTGRTALEEGPWSDFYSLSVLLYEMVSRRVPPDAQTRMDTVRNTGRDPYVPIVKRVGDHHGGQSFYTPELLKLIDLGCALLPKDRPKNARQFRSGLFDDNTPPLQLDHPETRPRKARDFANPAPALTPSQQSPKPQSRQRDERNAGTVKMALIILALALVASGYGIWGTFQ